MNLVKISVYITNYNYGNYIKQAIESVLNQTEQDFELLIIDDGSTDNSREIIESYSNHPKVKIIYQQNKGLNISNNIAMHASVGNYLIRLDADDYFEKTALKMLSDVLDADTSVGLVFPNYYLIDVDDHIISEVKRHDFEKDVTLYDQPAHGACTMIRKQYLEFVGGYDESFSCQDGYDLWIKFISDYKVVNVKESLFYYRQHGKNLTRNEERLLNTRIDIQKKYIEQTKVKIPVTIGIIPVRSLHTSQLCFEKIKNKTLLELKIESALKSEFLKKIVVTTSDHQVIDFIEKKKYGEKLIIVRRPKEYSRINASLYESIRLIFESNLIQPLNVKSFVLLALEYPFLNYRMIDSSIRSALIFKADTIISVRLDNASHYKHNGSTMLPIDEQKLTKYEREDLYESLGGLTYSTLANIQKNKKLPSGKISHVIIDEISGLEVNSQFTLFLAQYVQNYN